MSTEALTRESGTIPSTDSLPRLDRTAFRRPEPARPVAAPLDIVAALEELTEADGGLEANGLGDALLAFVMPRPNPALLSQARIAPLLGLAADVVARSRAMSPDVARLGAAALEQELRAQRALAERRATLVLRAGESGHG